MDADGGSYVANLRATDSFIALGMSLRDHGCIDQAIAAFRKAVDADATSAVAAYQLGLALLDRGDLDESMRWFGRAIDCEPDRGQFYLPLIYGDPAMLSEAHIARLLATQTRLDRFAPPHRIDFHFALGRFHEHAGRIDDAFAHFAAGNALKRQTIAYDEAVELGFSGAMDAVFSDPVMDAVRGCGDPSERPIFIFGMPRSGSTLVEQLLAAHPAVDAGGEIGILGSIVRGSGATLTASTLAQLRAAIRDVGQTYLRETNGLTGTGARLTDKTLYNMHFAPLINAMLPNARMIHVRRDALDTCFSCFATNFAPGQVPFSYDLGELGRYYRSAAAMMARWRATVDADRLLDVSYERLVHDFETEARRIVAFCGLAWDAACLQFQTVRRAVRTASNVQVRRPLYTDAIGRAQPFTSHLGPLLDALGPVAVAGADGARGGR